MISIFSNIFKYFYRVEVLILLFLIFSISVSALVADTSGTQPQEEPAPQEEVAPTPEPVPDPAPQEEEESNENTEEVVEEESEEEVADEEEPQAEEKPQKVTIKQSSNSEEETTEVEETEEEEKETTEQEEVAEEELTPDPAPQESTQQESAPAPKETAPQQQSSPPAPQNGGVPAEAEEVYICNEEEIVWGSAGQCSAVVPQGQGGDSPTLTTIDNTNPNFEGEATIACIDNIGWIQDSNPIVTYCNPIETAQEPITEETTTQQETGAQETVTGETHGGCHAMEVSWGITDRMCSADIAEADDGATSTVEDTTSPIIGSATFTCNVNTWELDTTVTATCTNEVFTDFGQSVATDGTRVIVGGTDGAGGFINGAEGVHIYETINIDGTLGDKVLLPIPSDIDNNSAFGDSVSISGNYAIVGAPGDDNGGFTNVGSAYIYERESTGDWGNPIALPLPTGLERNSFFGESVSISQNYAIVGANGDDSDIDGDGTTDADVGSAYIYKRNAVTESWGTPISLRLPTGLEEGSEFGFSVAIDRNYAIVGAVLDSNDIDGDGNPDTNVGSAYIYERNTVTESWGTPISLRLPTLDSDGSDDTGLEEGSEFGYSVSISGNYAIVGASNDDNERGESAGSAYIYKRVGDRNWSDPISLTLPTSTDSNPRDDTGLETYSLFGSSVSISGNYAIVGALGDDNALGEGAGSAYIYERVGENWGNPIAIALPSIDSDGSDDTGLEGNSWFSESVSISGDYAIVGAFGDDNDGVMNAGSVYTYSRSRPGNWDLLASTTRTATLAFAGCVAGETVNWGYHKSYV